MNWNDPALVATTGPAQFNSSQPPITMASLEAAYREMEAVSRSRPRLSANQSMMDLLKREFGKQPARDPFMPRHLFPDCLPWELRLLSGLRVKLDLDIGLAGVVFPRDPFVRYEASDIDWALACDPCGVPPIKMIYHIA